MRNKKLLGLTTALALTLSAAAGYAENIKIAFIDPLSGPFAATGEDGLHQYEFAADMLVNQKGGVLDGQMFEIVPFDNKISAKESLIQLQVAIDQGIRFIAQGNSSGVANALTDAINKHNKRNPDKRVLFLNYSAVDPALTNDKCNFWHFRFDANADIKMDALTDVIAGNDEIKKVYIIGQDYSFGKAVAAAAVRFLGEKRPDIEIVGNELHPIGKIKDFTPYGRKIMAAEADAVITGNWGADMLGLGKSILQNGFDGPIYTYYAASTGITAAFGESGVGSLKLVGEGQLNPPVSDRADAYAKAFKEKYPDDDLGQPRIANVIEMLARAINEAGTATDMVAVANALEGMEHDSIWGTKVLMRESDHQAIQAVHVQAHSPDVAHDFDNSGFGLLTENSVEMASADAPTTCKMKRP
ncbi:branched-chain amino acid ABC transporter substrate-binding protein [Tropicibacter sp. R16_0]|uniref:branched-chain amino acid ABC transporter substrate-binding protein n=1 Tax=Tropicibacter sp. R16_0 TaxID=2821102 RepID=UPI001ADB9C9D|nr:branched-chain amino acid ABC transporter substrate-binding protein [Tropicibacter sp. R16_0]MBO9449698.1 branched-chain amino acid ABC transporter substrate-binding protein [Tropicibacter sp. R16_0]